ncbi:MAG: M43 family zinc metalloprotease [Cyclobacteriaceae bacterium]
MLKSPDLVFNFFHRRRNWKALVSLGVPVLLFFIFPIPDTFSQSHVGSVFHQQHDQKCGAVYIEKHQQEDLGIFGTREFFEAWVEDKKNQLEKKGSSFRIQNGEVRKIPVVVHVIHHGEPIGMEANISEEQIMAQIRTLNEDFQMLNPDSVNTPEEFREVASSARIEFVMARQDPSGLPSNGIHRVVGPKDTYNLNDGPLIGELASWPPEEYLNIWVVPLTAPTIGFSSFPLSNELPGLDFPPPTRQTDGVTIDYRYFGSGGNAVSNSLGRTTTHEVGHYLGLRHTWGDGGCEVDDFVVDTPNQSQSNNVCSETPRFTCDSRDMIENFMDYTPDQCMSLFTEGQVERMDVVLAFSPRRHSLLTSRALLDPVLFDLDLSLEEILSPRDFACSNTLSPQIQITNEGMETVSETVLTVRLNGQTLQTKTFALDLQTGESGILEFAPITISTEDDNFFEAEIVEVNGSPDEDPTNNSRQSVPELVSEIPLPYFYRGHQESGSWDIKNSDNGVTWQPLSLSIDGVSQDLYYLNGFNYNVQGEIDYLISPKFDLTELTNAQLNFQLAYIPFDNEEFLETLIVAISTDCGNNFNIISAPYSKSGTRLATGPPSTEEFFPGSENQFRREILNLDEYAGFSDVRIAFVSLNGYGNNIFIKNININSEEEFRYDIELSALQSPMPVVNGDQESEILSVTNTGNLTIQSFFLDRQINDFPEDVLLFEDLDLAPGSTTEVVVPNLFSYGLNKAEYRVFEPNFDQNEDSENQLSRFFLQDTTTILTPWRQNFDFSETYIPWMNINPENNDPRWEIQPLEGGNGNAMVLEGMEPDQSYWLASPEFSLDGTNRASLFFDWAGGGFSSRGMSTLAVLITTDGGISAQKIWERGGQGLNSPGNILRPETFNGDDFERAYINLNEFTGNESVRLYLRLDNQDDPNGLTYLDNLELFLSDNPDPVEVGLNRALVYPNPADDYFNIGFNLEAYEDINIQIISPTGQVAYEKEFPNTLNQTYSFSRALLSKGLFILKINGETLTVTKRVYIR